MAEKKYIESVGRRKTATARVRITPSSKFDFIVNDKPFDEYFKTDTQRRTAKEALDVVKSSKYKITVKAKGSSLPSQAEAVRLGIARALVKEDETRRSELKEKGYLKRDPRKKERKKFGLKKARRAPQWSKR